jgi:hypothetical protein
MRKNYLFLVTAAIVMASCANDDFLGEGATTQDGKQAIEFNMSTPAMTRANTEGEDAAKKLSYQFIVWGEKNETGATSDTGNDLVFKNYRVQYKPSTAFTTTSNTKDWEYVGLPAFTANVSPVITGTQTIKYWDFGKTYTFTAVAAKVGDITAGLVKITKNSNVAEVLKKGYTIELAAGATADSIFVSDRITKKLDQRSANAADDAVQLQFRNFQSKIRFGIYETVPGYKAVITGIKSTEGEHSGTGSEKTFTVDGNFLSASDGITYTVTYASDGKAQVAASGTGTTANYLNTTGTNWLSTEWVSTTSTDKCVGEKATKATYDKTVDTDTKAYTSIMPNPNNTTDLTLQVKFDLYSEDTGEKIVGDYKTVKVPAEYCQWKSNYAYTYLFKITDKSADLYPITFDAVVVEDEYTGTQETITSVSEPSITTFGVKSNKYVSNENEYAEGDVIYATVLDGSTIAPLTTTGSTNVVNLYIITTDYTDKTVITEGAVENLMAHGTTSNTETTLTDVNKKEWKATKQTINTDDLVNEVPTEDGGTVKLDTAGTAKALKWTAGTSGTYYAVEYIKNSTEKYYKIVKIQ